jgi:hypothetical protein
LPEFPNPAKYQKSGIHRGNSLSQN